MAEWLKAAVLKTVGGETRSWVRIPVPPPFSLGALLALSVLGRQMLGRSILLIVLEAPFKEET